MMPGSAILTLFSSCLFSCALAGIEPQQAVWTSAPIGPDGPWNAVEVSLGGQANIGLFPGRLWSTFVTTTDYCAVNSTIPHCGSGTYDKDNAIPDAATGTALTVQWQPDDQQLSEGIEVLGTAPMRLDSIDLHFGLGAINNHSLALIENDSQMYEYPGGTRYPIFTGCLSLGATDRYQVFTGGDGGTTINATMIPWYLKDQGKTASSSFGLHIGSAGPTATMSGSLLYGGYDRNRVLGNVLAFDGDLWSFVRLQDIGIRVIDGVSPFTASSSGSGAISDNIAGLLAQGNSSITSAGLSVLIDPCTPYLTLPKSTCDAIASHLPVSYNSSLGLYLWNTSAPHYSRIVASASALTFTFMGESNTQTGTINVPFRHLNLTLSPPFTDTPVPYFPCFTGGTGQPVLGRAFLQDAFLGANWEQKKVFLAQAPGPNIPSGVDAVNVQPGDVTVAASSNDWKKSWEGFWTALSADQADGNAPVSVSVSSTPTHTGSSGQGGSGSGSGSSNGAASSAGVAGLSTAAVAGIAVGAAVGGMAVVGAAVLFWRRRRKLVGQAAPEAAPQPPPAPPYYDTKDAFSGWMVEAPDNTRKVHEMPPPERVYEMMGDQPDGPVGWGAGVAR